MTRIPLGDAPCAELRSRIEVLFAGLEQANRLFVERGDAGRLGVIAWLNAFDQFLSLFEGSIDLRQPGGALLNAFVSLNEGQRPPLLEPRKRQGRAPASTLRECDMGHAVATVHALCGTGLGRKKPYEQVAKVCREAGLKPTRKGAKDSQGQEPVVTAHTVRYWDRKIAEDVGRHSEAAKAFDHLRQSWAANAQGIAQVIEIKGVEAVRKGLLEGLRLTLIQRRASEH